MSLILKGVVSFAFVLGQCCVDKSFVLKCTLNLYEGPAAHACR